MKYVKVIDGYNHETHIMPVIRRSGNMVVCELRNVIGKGEIYVPDTWITNQADTIEELCDRFVFEYKKYDENGQIVCRFWRDYLFMEVALETFNDCKIKDKVIYGAIITDKGLIYVAKMNADGELVLI